MRSPSAPQLTRAERRQAMRLSYFNGGIWAVGNGLASTQLVLYLALELGAAGLAVSLIMAMPRLIGLLRLAAPALIARMGDRRRFCLQAFLISSVLLFALPLVSAPGVLASPRESMIVLVVLWSGYHLLEYCGMVALWSWLGDLAPLRVRGRFFGRRERWMTLGRIVGMVVSGVFAWHWWKNHPSPERWIGYAIPAAAGALLMIGSLVPLARMAAPIAADVLPGFRPGAALLTPFRDRRFLWLVAFGAWFSFVNGVTQAAQGIYPARVLQFHLFWILAFESLMRLGQSVISPWAGRFCDRYGNRPLMILCQAIVSLGPLFYLLATPSAPWWLTGAWLMWIAYAGLNIGLPNLTLKFAPPGEASSYIALFFAISGVAYGVSTIAGGLLFDLLNQPEMRLAWRDMTLDAFDYLFLAGWLGRLLGAVMLIGLVEPGAWSWRKIVRRNDE